MMGDYEYGSGENELSVNFL